MVTMITSVDEKTNLIMQVSACIYIVFNNMIKIFILAYRLNIFM